MLNLLRGTIKDLVGSTSSYPYVILIIRSLFLNNHNTTSNNDLTNSSILTRNNEKISAHFNIKNTSKNIILFLHGTSDNITSFVQNYKINTIHNYCVIDYKGFGDSEGEFIFQNVTEDVNDVINYLKNSGYEKIYVVGVSLGSTVALSYLQKHDYVVKYVLFCPFVSTLNVLRNNEHWKKYGWLLGKNDDEIGEWLELLHTLEFEGKTDNVVIYYGKYDDVVPKEDIDVLKALFDVQILEECDHTSVVLNCGAWDEIDKMINSE